MVVNDKNLAEVLHQHEHRLTKVEGEMAAHEKLCSERYSNILSDIKHHGDKLSSNYAALTELRDHVRAWGVGLKIFMYAVGLFGGIPIFLLTCLKIYKELASIGI